MTPATSVSRLNYLLAALPQDEWERLLPQLEHVELPFGKVVHESGGAVSHVYFPTTAIGSLMYLTESGASSEFAVVGREGIVGVSFFLGGDTTPLGAIVGGDAEASKGVLSFRHTPHLKGIDAQATRSGNIGREIVKEADALGVHTKALQCIGISKTVRLHVAREMRANADIEGIMGLI